MSAESKRKEYSSKLNQYENRMNMLKRLFRFTLFGSLLIIFFCLAITIYWNKEMSEIWEKVFEKYFIHLSIAFVSIVVGLFML